VFQGAQAALHPLQRIGDQIARVLMLHGKHPRRDAAEEARRLLRLVQIDDPERRFFQYPRELSGGLCQRAMIALAIAARPALLIADEPTSALDVTIQRGILALLSELRSSMGMSILLISHDLGVVAEICDRVAVMYRGKLVEEAPARQLFTNPKHPYTRLLLESAPHLPGPAKTPEPVRETVVDPIPSTGCIFAARCVHRMSACAQEPPFQDRDRHRVACWLSEADVDKE